MSTRTLSGSGLTLLMCADIASFLGVFLRRAQILAHVLHETGVAGLDRGEHVGAGAHRAALERLDLLRILALRFRVALDARDDGAVMHPPHLVGGAMRALPFADGVGAGAVAGH